MYCSFCGTALQVGVTNCTSCGSPTPSGTQDSSKIIQKPLSLQQSSKGQAVRSNAAPSSPPSKLSDYKPAGSPGSKQPLNPNSASMRGIAPASRLSSPGQTPGPLSKLSDYRQPAVQRSKLSDYNTGTNPGMQPASTPGSIDLASMPTAGPDTFSNTTTTPFPPPSVPPSPPPTPIAYPSGIQPVNPPPMMPNMANGANMSNSPNTSSFVLATERSAFNPPPQVGALPVDMATAKQGKRGGLLMGAIAIILLIVCIGAATLFFLQKTNNSNRTVVATKTVVKPLPTVAPIHGPSGNASVPAISALFSVPQMTTGIDSNDKATQITNTFTSGQTIYVTFSLNSKYQKGYVEARWYNGKQLFREVEFAHDPYKTNGYFSVVYDAPTTDGSIELYWSTTASLSDAKLAQVAHFTVSK